MTPTRRRALDTRPAVLVTGASKGIGEACAIRLVRDGFRVFAGVRREEDGMSLIHHGGDAIIPLMLDITSAAQVRDAAAHIEEETGGRGLHGLVNNAGVAVAGPLEFLPIEELRRQLEINVIGQIAVTQATLPLLRRARTAGQGDDRAGRIVFMSSVAGRSSLPFVGAYAASKFALEAAADALRMELRPFGLSVAVVEPGVIATPIWETSRAAAERTIAQLPPQLEEYYGTVLDALRRRIAATGGLPPERVAEVVSRALTARRPRTRYVVGHDARARILLGALPDRMRDWIVWKAVQRQV